MNLQKAVSDFRMKVERDFPTPSPRDSVAFVITEAAEVLDAMLKAGYCDARYLRNRPLSKDIEGELGDLVLMVATLANGLGVNLNKALYKSMAKIEERIKTACADQPTELHKAMGIHHQEGRERCACCGAHEPLEGQDLCAYCTDHFSECKWTKEER
jgi:NTP pyrophosphatase (non-canonical NTP hydrolase)